MPSYPTSVKSFTTKNSNDVANSAHVNDLQDEVTAIESGLRNGTAPINAAASTITSLSVTGGSTFAVRPIEPPPDAALVYLESTGAVGSSALSTVVFTGEDYKTNSSVHSTGTNPERLTPQTTGVYGFAAQITFSAPSANSTLQLLIRDSSGTVLAARAMPGVVGAGNIQVVATKRFDVIGGYGSLTFNNAGGGSTISLSTGAGVSWFSMVKY